MSILGVLYRIVGKNKELMAARRQVQWSKDSRFIYPPSCHHVHFGANARSEASVRGRVLQLR
jgi:hypothetical protein